MARRTQMDAGSYMVRSQERTVRWGYTTEGKRVREMTNGRHGSEERRHFWNASAGRYATEEEVVSVQQWMECHS